MTFRTLSADRQALSDYRAQGGYQALAAARALPPAEVGDRVGATGLRGRGGAGFPAAKKWELARTTAGGPKVVVGNGGEHEPGSRKDRVLLTAMPHRVLEGLAIAAHATGATIGYLYLIEDMAEAITAVREAIDEATTAGLLRGFEVHVALAPTTYVAGEETAALEVIEGRPALPRQKPPLPGQAGLWGRPTTVNNVETLARVPAALAGEGAPFGPGWMLCTLDDSLARPGVYDVPLGTTFRELVYEVGGGPRGGRPVKALQPALSAALLPASALEVKMTHEDVRAAGSNLGCAGVHVVEAGTCVVERAVEIARFFAREQCGQCPPCRMLTANLASILDRVKGGETGDYATAFERLVAFAGGRGRCALPTMAAAPTTSALRLFPEDFAHHATHGTCPGATSAAG